MYPKPELTRVGDAREVVLGTFGVGLDLDTTYYYGHGEFEDDDLDPVGE
jgi:hypothetical protein